MDKAEYKKRGAPKGTVTNPKGNNQYENIYAKKPAQANLLIEDYELLEEISKDKPRGWKSDFIREAISKALKEYVQQNGSINRTS